MHYGRLTISMRTILQLTTVMLFVLVGSWPAFAAGNSGPVPQLVPFTINLLAGNGNSGSLVTGYGGDGGPGAKATLNNPGVLAVDSVGNVYFPDRSSAIIREINDQTGVITTVGGVEPSACSGTLCKTVSLGCADGVPALGNPIASASMYGIAVDGFGNIYFSDQGNETISVIYRGGSRVANFIQLENPTGVAKAGGVKPGYVYHIAGTIDLSSCSGTPTTDASSTKVAVPSGDGNLAFQNATLGTPGPLALDAAGNLYVADSGPEGAIRVINTQPTPQDFYQYSGKNAVAPGAIQSIVNCGETTVTCPVGYGSSPVTLANTGVGGPANAAVFNTLANHNGQYMYVDAYGNIYELNAKGATPDILIGAAYAGGAGNTLLQGLINTSLSGDTYVGGATSITAQAGDFYYLMHGSNPIIRPSSIVADPFGNLYYQDNHYAQVYRVDVNAHSSTATLLAFSAGLFANNRLSNTPTAATPTPFCYPITPSSNNLPTAGYTTPDAWGDGCPAIYAEGPGDLHTGNGFGSTITDGQGNLYMADQTHNIIRKVTNGNIFPATTVGQAVNATTLAGQQEIDVHFDGNNLPPTETTIAPTITTNAFSIKSSTSDFSINPISSNFSASTASGPVSGITIGTNSFTQPVSTGIVSDPICGNNTGFNDSSLECIVNVIFSPTGPGLRQAQLTAKTVNGSTYSFGLSGIGVGPQLAIDGGTPTALSLPGIGNPGQVAISSTGDVYVADPNNNRVVVSSASGNSSTTVGTGLKNPMGVAVDAAGNVFIADTGNNRIVEVPINTGVQVTIGQTVETGSPAYIQYSFKAPQAVAVDLHGNVYVADTGNAAVVEIPAHPDLGGAVPLLQYPGAPTFTNPVGIAVDSAGNIYVADTGSIQIIELPPGGGDLQNLLGTSFEYAGRSVAVQNSVFAQPSAVAVDAAGNLYVADSGATDNTGANLIYEVPNNTGSGSETLTLNFPNLHLTGSGSGSSTTGGSIALDQSGNIYVANPGAGQVLYQVRQNPTVNFGSLPVHDPAVEADLTLTNIGNAPLTLTNPVLQLNTGANSTGAYTATTLCSAGTLAPGQHCSITTQYFSSATGPQTASVVLNGGGQTLSLTGAAISPRADTTLAVTSPAGGALRDQPATVTATVTQPYGSFTPTGNVLFSYTLNDATQDAGTLVPISNGTATYNLPTLLRGRKYVVTATYQGDAYDSPSDSTKLTIYIPGIPVTAVANSVTFTYGSNPPAITGTLSGILPADQGTVTYKFVTDATKSTPVGVYPIRVVFTGGEYLDYGFPTVLTPGGAPATATETQAALTVQANDATTVYGGVNPHPDASFTSTFTGLVNSDAFVVNYTPASSSILNVGTYPIVPTVLGTKAANYTITAKNGKLTVTQQIPVMAVSNTTATVLPGSLSSDPLLIVLSNPIGKGVPSGTVTLTDTFTPVIPSAPGLGTPAAPVTIGPLPLVAGSASYTITSQTPGIHSFSVLYNGDNNFKPVSSTGSTSIEVDASDFVVSSTTNPIQIAPGVIPGGNNSIAGEAAATPEQATVTISSVQSFTGTIYLGCQPQNPSYVTCTLSPAAVTLAAPASGSTTSSATATLSISTPATLPLGFFSSELRRPVSTTVLAFVPFGALAFCFRRRRSLSKALWMLAAISTITVGLSGCGSTTVAFFTPVPAGPQSVTVYACSVQAACTTSNPVTNPLTGTGAGVIRSFNVSISIQ